MVFFGNPPIGGAKFSNLTQVGRDTHRQRIVDIGWLCNVSVLVTVRLGDFVVLTSLVDALSACPPSWTHRAEFSESHACPFCDCSEVGRQWEDHSSALFCEVGVLWRVYAHCRHCRRSWWTWHRELASPVESEASAEQA